MFGDSSLMVAMGFEGFIVVANTSEVSVALGKTKKGRVKTLAIGGRAQATAAADDFLRENETGDAAKKSKRWLDQNPTDKQLTMLRDQGVEIGFMDFSWTKYRASCMLSYLWNKDVIDSKVENILE